VRRLATTTAPEFESYSFDPFASVWNTFSVEGIQKLQLFAWSSTLLQGGCSVEAFVDLRGEPRFSRPR
jgi:hypothetical protein